MTFCLSEQRRSDLEGTFKLSLLTTRRSMEHGAAEEWGEGVKAKKML
jgi:hypothetical protein